jgi:hypothetical protein
VAAPGLSCRPKTRHTSLALYVLIRGVALLMRCGNKPDAPPLLRRCAMREDRGPHATMRTAETTAPCCIISRRACT